MKSIIILTVIVAVVAGCVQASVGVQKLFDQNVEDECDVELQLDRNDPDKTEVFRLPLTTDTTRYYRFVETARGCLRITCIRRSEDTGLIEKASHDLDPDRYCPNAPANCESTDFVKKSSVLCELGF